MTDLEAFHGNSAHNVNHAFSFNLLLDLFFTLHWLWCRHRSETLWQTKDCQLSNKKKEKRRLLRKHLSRYLPRLKLFILSGCVDTFHLQKKTTKNVFYYSVLMLEDTLLFLKCRSSVMLRSRELLWLWLYIHFINIMYVQSQSQKPFFF